MPDKPTELAAHTRVKGYAQGVLDVAVDSAPLRAELQGFSAHSLARALSATREGADVASIRFVLMEEPSDVRQASSRRARARRP